MYLDDAEKEGFEPPEPFSSTVFKTAAIDHSAISPMLRFQSAAKIRIFAKKRKTCNKKSLIADYCYLSGLLRKLAMTVNWYCHCEGRAGGLRRAAARLYIADVSVKNGGSVLRMPFVFEYVNCPTMDRTTQLYRCSSQIQYRSDC